MNFVYVICVISALYLICIYAITIVGTMYSKKLFHGFAKSDKREYLRNLNESEWIGYRRGNEKLFNSPKVNHTDTNLLKWKFDTITDAAGKTHVVDRYPHISLENLQKWPLYNTETGELVSPESVHMLGENLYETLPNGEYKYRVQCPSPLTQHADIPWQCFSDPCGRLTQERHYDSVNRVCNCGDKFVNAVADDRHSCCVPRDAREFYDEKRETLQLRVPCWNGSGSSFDAYPCMNLNEVPAATIRIKMRFCNASYKYLFNPSHFNDLHKPEQFQVFF